MQRVWIAERFDSQHESSVVSCHRDAAAALRILRSVFPGQREYPPCGVYEEGETEFLGGDGRLLGRVVSYPFVD